MGWLIDSICGGLIILILFFVGLVITLLCSAIILGAVFIIEAWIVVILLALWLCYVIDRGNPYGKKRRNKKNTERT